MASLTYGQAITGVAPTTLLAQRRAVAAAAAPASGQGGQDLDLALIMADGSADGKADPAYDAHIMPIGMWADAVWGQWLPIPSLDKDISFIKAKFNAVKSTWQHVKGPAAATVASARRLGWEVSSAVKFVTDTWGSP